MPRFEKRRVFYMAICPDCGFQFAAIRSKPAHCPKKRCKTKRREEAKKNRQRRPQA